MEIRLVFTITELGSGPVMLMFANHVNLLQVSHSITSKRYNTWNVGSIIVDCKWFRYNLVIVNLPN